MYRNSVALILPASLLSPSQFIIPPPPSHNLQHCYLLFIHPHSPTLLPSSPTEIHPFLLSVLQTVQSIIIPRWQKCFLFSLFQVAKPTQLLNKNKIPLKLLRYLLHFFVYSYSCFTVDIFSDCWIKVLISGKEKYVDSPSLLFGGSISVINSIMKHYIRIFCDTQMLNFCKKKIENK